MAPSLHSIIPENRNKQMLKQEEEAHTLFSLRNRTTLELGLHVDRRFNTHNSIDATRREPKIEANRDITEKKNTNKKEKRGAKLKFVQILGHCDGYWVYLLWHTSPPPIIASHLINLTEFQRFWDWALGLGFGNRTGNGTTRLPPGAVMDLYRILQVCFVRKCFIKNEIVHSMILLHT